MIAEAKMEHDILETRAKNLRDKAAKANPGEQGELEAEAKAAARALAGHVVPVSPRVIVDDVTPERLGTMLAEQGGRLAVMSPEGGVFELIAGRYSANGAPNLDVFLKSHPGDTLRVDRGTRPPDYVRKPALTVALAVQPDVLHRLAAVPEFRGRGLLARFCYAIPTSRLGRRDPDAPVAPRAVMTEYARRIRALLDVPVPPDGEDGEPAPHPMPLSPGASARFQEFRRRLEPRLVAAGDLAPLADWAAKLPGTLARLAGLLHVADLGADPAGWRTAIPETTMGRAVTLSEYLIAHARLAFRGMGLAPAFARAARLVSWFRARRPTTFRRRDLHRELAGTFPRIDDLAPALALLVEYGYLRDVSTPTPGRRPSVTYAVNPTLYDNLDNLDNGPRSEPRGEAAVEVDKVVLGPSPVDAGEWAEV